MLGVSFDESWLCFNNFVTATKTNHSKVHMVKRVTYQTLMMYCIILTMTWLQYEHSNVTWISFVIVSYLLLVVSKKWSNQKSFGLLLFLGLLIRLSDIPRKVVIKLWPKYIIILWSKIITTVIKRIVRQVLNAAWAIYHTLIISVRCINWRLPRYKITFLFTAGEKHAWWTFDFWLATFWVIH